MEHNVWYLAYNAEFCIFRLFCKCIFFKYASESDLNYNLWTYNLGLLRWGSDLEICIHHKLCSWSQKLNLVILCSWSWNAVVSPYLAFAALYGIHIYIEDDNTAYQNVLELKRKYGVLPTMHCFLRDILCRWSSRTHPNLAF